MGKSKTIIAALTLAAAALPLTAQAQQVWRCGSSYSQQPCPGGTAVRAEDARTASDAAQAQSAVRREAKAADELENARLAREAQAAPANILPEPKVAAKSEPKAGPTRSTAKAKSGSKPKKPDYFTAVSPKKSVPATAAKKKSGKSKPSV